jgi:uncharacterized protein YbbC (DUF1343 family)
LCALLGAAGARLAGKRVGLVSHAAAVDPAGCTAAERLRRDPRFRLVCLFGPEHGYFGLAGAGVPCRGGRHPEWGIPVHSLYGRNRKPAAAMLRGLDALVFDLQDLGVRAYTYVSTLRLVLEAAAENGKEVIVADRPVPLPRVVDGPVAEPRSMSFVASVDLPLCYGMTPGETALWIKRRLGLDLGLSVARMAGYGRGPGWDPDWPPWIPPSPSIVSWESARCYPAAVAFEGLVSVDHGRGTPMPFRVFGAPWMRSAEVIELLDDLRLPGTAFHAHRYCAARPPHGGLTLDGVRITVTGPHSFRPALTAVSIAYALQRLYGRKRVWAIPPERAGFFDKLMGTPSVREALLDGEHARAIASRWAGPLAEFRRGREECLLYSAS